MDLINTRPPALILPAKTAAAREGMLIISVVINALRTLHTALSAEYQRVWHSTVEVKDPDGTIRTLTPQEVFDGLTVAGQPAAALLLHAHALLALPAEAARAFLASSLAPIPTAIPEGYTVTPREDGGLTVGTVDSAPGE